MKKLIMLFALGLFLISISVISALCEEGQIDINSASVDELDKIVHVGPKVAGYIIEQRVFNSLDELINVSYISSGYLEDIINQGLACVNGETKKIVEKTPEEPEESNEVKEEYHETLKIIEDANIQDNLVERPSDSYKTPIPPDVIKLNTKLNTQNIKSDNNKENLDKSNYAVYGFVAFCVLLGVLFIIKNKKYKNEFR